MSRQEVQPFWRSAVRPQDMIAPDPTDHEHAPGIVDPTWIMRPFIDRWVMLVSFLAVNPRLPRPR